jgi:hypothetical protein
VTGDNDSEIVWVGGWRSGAITAALVVAAWAFISFYDWSPRHALPPVRDERPPLSVEDEPDADGELALEQDASIALGTAEARARIPLSHASASAAPTPLPRVPTAQETATELSLLEKAQSALAGDPEQTLALADESIRRFPDGVLREHAEVLAIEALLHARHVDVARERAKKFHADHPRSIHGAAIDALFGTVK